MRQFGLSAVVVAALATQVAASNPPFAPTPAPQGWPGAGSYPMPAMWGASSAPGYAMPGTAMPGYPPQGWPGAAGHPMAQVSGAAPMPGYAMPGYPPELATFPGGGPPGVMPPVSLSPGDWAAAQPGPAGTPPEYSYPLDPNCAQQPCAPKVGEEYWISGDWLYWKFRDAPVPPLIVTTDPSGAARPLVGPSRDLGTFNGLRASFGQWFDPDGELGAEISGFIFEHRGAYDVFQGGPSLPLAVPVMSAAGPLGVYDFSSPGRFVGALGVQTRSSLLGAEATLLHRWHCKPGVTVDGLFGYRFLTLNENLNLFGVTQSVDAPASFAGTLIPAGVQVATSDYFRVRNEFHGGQLGARMAIQRGIFMVSATAKGGMGVNIQTLCVEGNSRAAGLVVPGGIRALPSNIKRDTNNDFSMISEVGFEFGIQVTKHVTVRAGYSLLYWTDVVRPANVISPVTTRSQVPIDPTFGTTPLTNARPVNVFRSSDFLAHGLVVGAVFGW